MRIVRVLVGLWLGLGGGCRTSAPELKPGKQAEVLVCPPAGDHRYDSPIYPKEAFNEKYDPRKSLDAFGGPGPKMGGPMMPAGGMGGN